MGRLHCFTKRIVAILHNQLAAAVPAKDARESYIVLPRLQAAAACLVIDRVAVLAPFQRNNGGNVLPIHTCFDFPCPDKLQQIVMHLSVHFLRGCKLGDGEQRQQETGCNVNKRQGATTFIWLFPKRGQETENNEQQAANTS